MTGRRPVRKHGGGGGKGLLICMLLIIGLFVLKYADTPFARSAREKAAEVFGGFGMEHVLAVLGGADKDEGAENVFSAQTGADTGAGKTDKTDKADYAASSGGADDILGREQTLFPDTVDETVYPMKFEHKQPADGTLTSSFGSRLSPITGQPGFHYGLDIAADEGVPIGAFADGTVREVGESSYGKYLIMDHADGFSTLYAHCSSISAKVGDTFTCGQEIARVGQTGNATGPHLHLELWKDGAALDPTSYLTAA